MLSKHFTKWSLAVWFLCLYCTLFAQLSEIKFRHLDYRDGLPQYSVLDAMVSDHLGRIWLGYSSGLYRYDGYEVQTFVPNIHDSTALSELIINTLFIDPRDHLWIGTRNMGICIYNPETDQFSRLMPASQGGRLPVGTIWDIHLDNDGIYWFGSEPGLIRHDPVSGSFEHYRFSDPEMKEEDVEYINTLRSIRASPTDEQILWIGTRGGLLSFHKSNGEFTFHPMPYSSAEIGLKDIDYMLFKLEFTSDVDLWASTWGGGLLHYNVATATWRQFRNPGISPKDDVGYCLEKRDDRSFWFGTNGAFGIFDHHDLKYHFLKTSKEATGDLRWSQMFSVFLQSSDGALVIGGSLGINISQPQKAASTFEGVYPYPPLLTKLQVNNQRFLSQKSLVYTNEIWLDKQQNTLHFTVALPTYHYANEVRYRFLMEGINDTWLESGNTRSVQYTNLRPGKYRFRYQASLDGVNWIDGKTTPAIRITQPFWQHPFFITGLITVILGIVGLFIHLRIRHFRQEVKLKMEYNQRLAENEMKALRAQMNPHFMFNSLNSIKHYILTENKKDASRYLTKFSQLMRAILANSEHKLVTLEEELHALNLYLEIEAMRFNQEFKYTIVSGPEIDKSRVLVPPLLIQPFVENAIWHGLLPKGADRTLDICITGVNGMLEICIEDNGIGRKASALRNKNRNGHEKSMGMKLTADRIALIKNMLNISAHISIVDLENPTGQPIGTRVNIIIPEMNEYIMVKEKFTS